MSHLESPKRFPSRGRPRSACGTRRQVQQLAAFYNTADRTRARTAFLKPSGTSRARLRSSLSPPSDDLVSAETETEPMKEMSSSLDKAQQESDVRSSSLPRHSVEKKKSSRKRGRKKVRKKKRILAEYYSLATSSTSSSSPTSASHSIASASRSRSLHQKHHKKDKLKHRDTATDKVKWKKTKRRVSAPVSLELGTAVPLRVFGIHLPPPPPRRSLTSASASLLLLPESELAISRRSLKKSRSSEPFASPLSRQPLADVCALLRMQQKSALQKQLPLLEATESPSRGRARTQPRRQHLADDSSDKSVKTKTTSKPKPKTKKSAVEMDKLVVVKKLKNEMEDLKTDTTIVTRSRRGCVEEDASASSGTPAVERILTAEKSASASLSDLDMYAPFSPKPIVLRRTSLRLSKTELGAIPRGTGNPLISFFDDSSEVSALDSSAKVVPCITLKAMNCSKTVDMSNGRVHLALALAVCDTLAMVTLPPVCGYVIESTVVMLWQPRATACGSLVSMSATCASALAVRFAHHLAMAPSMSSLSMSSLRSGRRKKHHLDDGCGVYFDGEISLAENTQQCVDYLISLQNIIAGTLVKGRGSLVRSDVMDALGDSSFSFMSRRKTRKKRKKDRNNGSGVHATIAEDCSTVSELKGSFMPIDFLIDESDCDELLFGRKWPSALLLKMQTLGTHVQRKYFGWIDASRVSVFSKPIRVG